MVRCDSELLLPLLPFFPIHPPPSPSSLLTPISLPFLPSLPPISISFSSSPSNQLSVHIHLPTPIRCGIGNHYTNTHCNFITPPHASINQVHRSLHATSHRLQVYKQWADLSGICTYTYIGTCTVSIYNRCVRIIMQCALYYYSIVRVHSTYRTDDNACGMLPEISRHKCPCLETHRYIKYKCSCDTLGECS